MVNTRERIQAIVDSSKRLNTSGTETSTNFTYSFNRSVTRITEIVIQSIQFPFTFYCITSANNVLRVNNGGATKSVTINPGNYTATSMISILTAALNTEFAGQTFAITFSSITFKFTITNGTNFTIFAKTTDPLSTMAYAMGFQSDSLVGLSTSSDSAINLSGPKYIRIESKFLSAPTQHKPLYADSSYNTSLFVLPVNAGFGSFISTDVQIPIRLTYKFNIQTTDKIDFLIVDDADNILDLNGSDWSMYIIFITE